MVEVFLLVNQLLEQKYARIAALARAELPYFIYSVFTAWLVNNPPLFAKNPLS